MRDRLPLKDPESKPGEQIDLMASSVILARSNFAAAKLHLETHPEGCLKNDVLAWARLKDEETVINATEVNYPLLSNFSAADFAEHAGLSSPPTHAQCQPDHTEAAGHVSNCPLYGFHPASTKHRCRPFRASWLPIPATFQKLALSDSSVSPMLNLLTPN